MKISKTAVIFFWTTIVLSIVLDSFSGPVIEYIRGDPLRIATTAITLLFLAFLSWHIYSIRSREELLSQYELFKEACRLDPKDLFFQRIEPGESVSSGYRPYYNTYIHRRAIPYDKRDDNNPAPVYDEEQLKEFLENSFNLLLIGGPTEGKTRTLYEIIRALRGFVVIKVKPGTEPTAAALELLKGKKIVWLVDDLHALPESGLPMFHTLLTKIVNVQPDALALAGTSRNANDLGKLEATASLREFYRAFTHKLVLMRPNEEDFKRLKDDIQNTDPRIFPTLGAICMQQHFGEMHVRFDQMGQFEKNCVLSLILLNKAFIYEMTQQRIQTILRDVFKHENMDGAKLLCALGRLKDDGFILPKGVSGVVIPEAAYITGEEATYYYRVGTIPENRKPEDDMAALEACLLKNADAFGMNQLALSRFSANKEDAALSLWEQINIQFGESFDPALREQVARALCSKGTLLGALGDNAQAMACYDLVEKRYGNADPALQQWVAMALYCKGVALALLGDPKQEIACYDLVEKRYGNALGPAVRQWVAMALYNKGVALGQLGDREQEITCYRSVEERYGDTPDPALRQWVARALYNKGVALKQLGDREQEIACYDLLEKRYGNASEPALQQWVARALCSKGFALAQLGDREQEIACYDLLEKRYGNASEPALQEWVARALCAKGVALGQLGDHAQAMACYDLVEKRYGNADPALQQWAAMALYNKGVALGQLGDHAQAIACYDLLEKRYGNADPALQQWAAMALYNKGVVLAQLGDLKQEIACYDLLEKRYGNAPDPALQQWAAMALYNKGVALGQLGDHAQAIACYDLLEKRYGNASEPALQQWVVKALFNKGLTLGRLGDPDQTITCFSIIVERYRTSIEPPIQAIVKQATALINQVRRY